MDINKLLILKIIFFSVFAIPMWESNVIEAVRYLNEFKDKDRRIFNDNQRVHRCGM
jgi:hypothetical protein